MSHGLFISARGITKPRARSKAWHAMHDEYLKARASAGEKIDAGSVAKASGGVSVRNGNEANLQKKNRADAAGPAARERLHISQIRSTATEPWWTG